MMALKMDSGYRPWWLSYPAVAALFLLEVVAAHLILLSLGFSYPDTRTYVSAAAELSAGRLDYLRTPGYPAVIMVLEGLFGARWPSAMYVLQTLCMLLGALLLQRAGQRYIGRPRVVFWVVTVWLLFSGVAQYCALLLTEALAVSALCALLYFALRPLSWRSVIGALLSLTFLVSLRPAMMSLIAVLALYYAVLLYRHRTRPLPAIVALAGIALLCLGLWGYRQAITRSFGIHALTYVTTINGAYLVCPLTEFSDPEDLLNSGTLAETQERVSSVIREQPLPVLQLAARRWYLEAYREPMLDSSPGCPYSGLLRPITPNLGFMALALLTLTVACCYVWHRQRRMPLRSLMLAAVVWGILLTAVMGAQAEWTRHTLPALPAFFLLAGRALSCLRVRL